VTGFDVAIVGGGLAGVSAALTAADAGARVVVFEKRSHLGGAASSFRRNDVELDYGQHVFLRCCTAYRSLIGRIKGESDLCLQDRLELPVLDGDPRPAWLRRANLPSPLHLAGALMRYHHLSPGERAGLIPTARALKRLDTRDASLDEVTFESWLKRQGQSERAIQVFWDLIALPALNLPSSQASLLIAAQTFQMGLLTAADAADIGWATVPLSRLHDWRAHTALVEAGVEVHLRSRVMGVRVQPGRRAEVVTSGGHALAVEAVIPAVEARAFPGLFGAAEYLPASRVTGLETSPIVNVHLFFDRCVLPFPLAATLHPAAPWVFDRTESAGIDMGQYLVVPISSADRLVDVAPEAIMSGVLEALSVALPALSEAALVDWLVIKDPAATVRLRPGSAALRTAVYSRECGVFPAGSWIDTGWPATMESAVRSGCGAARAALGIAGGREGL
jgi:squalene-associated FAD-dependent desaturase